jgi:hypothetical protein
METTKASATPSYKISSKATLVTAVAPTVCSVRNTRDEGKKKTSSMNRKRDHSQLTPLDCLFGARVLHLPSGLPPAISPLLRTKLAFPPGCNPLPREL